MDHWQWFKHPELRRSICVVHGMVRCKELIGKKIKLRQAIVRAWDKHHFPTPAEELCDPPPLPAALKPTDCFVHGYGNCCCRGFGRTCYLAKRKFCASIAKLAPKKSKMKRLLMSAFLVVEIQGVFFHLALMYLKPRRATFIQLRFESRISERLSRFSAPLTKEATFDILMDIEAFMMFDWTAPQTYSQVGA